MSSRPFRPLRRRSVLLVWGAGLLSDVGTWVQLIVVGSLVASATGSALYTGLTALAMFTPQGLCAPIGGLLADRFDRRKVFVGALLAQAAATSVLALVLAAGFRNPLVLSACILLSSASGALGQPAYSAILPDLVPPEELMAMVSLGIYSWNGGRIAGPLLGTVLVGLFGPAWTVAFNAVTFAVMAGAVALVRRSFLPPGTDAEGIGERLAEGWQSLRRVPGCRYGIVGIMILNISVGPFMGLIPIYARNVFGGGTGFAGALSALQGVGAIAGSLTMTVLAVRVSRARLMTGAVAMLVGAYAVYALAPIPLVAGLAVMLLGAGSASIFVSAMAIVQRDAPAATRGRVLALSQAAMGSMYGLGVLWIGTIGDVANLRVAFMAACAAAGGLSLAAMRRAPHWRQVVDGEIVDADELEARTLPTAEPAIAAAA